MLKGCSVYMIASFSYLIVHFNYLGTVRCRVRHYDGKSVNLLILGICLKLFSYTVDNQTLI